MVQEEPGYRWSVVAVALLQYGKPLVEMWSTDQDRDIRGIKREKLKKARLVWMDADCIKKLHGKIEG